LSNFELVIEVDLHENNTKAIAVKNNIFFILSGFTVKLKQRYGGN
jgi:hypothetical protein